MGKREKLIRRGTQEKIKPKVRNRRKAPRSTKMTRKQILIHNKTHDQRAGVNVLLNIGQSINQTRAEWRSSYPEKYSRWNTNKFTY